ncbi:MAG: HD domain-containing protein [Solobacterium sp.]|nr:HD domain-containing protein [Solobacterium sp.]
MRDLSFYRMISQVLIAFLLAIGIGSSFLPVNAEEGQEESSNVLAIDPSEADDGYSAVLYNNSNGLPTSEANAIAETEEGFLWIGSYSGLIRYDGNEFERYDSTNGIASVVSLYVDHLDRLWVGTNDSGAGVMEQGQFRMINKNDGLKSLSVRSITEDLNGVIYLGTARGLAITDDTGAVELIEDWRLSEQYIRRMETGADGIIYGVTQDGAVFTLKNRELSVFLDEEALSIPHVRSVLPDADHPGYVYLGTESSEVYYGELTQNGLNHVEVIDVAPLSYVNEIGIFGDQIWYVADNGIAMSKHGELQIMDNVPLNNSVEHLRSDYEGNIWFTSSRQGVMKIVPNQFADLSEPYNLSEMVVNTTCKYGDDLMIGSDTGLVVLGPDGVKTSWPVDRITNASGEEYAERDLIDLLGHSRIRSIIPDRDGNLWIATYSSYGLVYYDGSQIICYTTVDGMPSERIRTSYQLEDGTILAPCSGGGVIAIQDGVISGSYHSGNGLSNADILTVAEADNGDLLFGSDGDGIYILNGQEVQHVGVEDGLGSDVVMRLKKDSEHHVFWIVTSNSISYMDESYHVETIREFPYSNNFDLYESASGDMWILSSNGIYVVPSTTLLENGEITPVFYGRENGLSTIATANSYSALTENGDLYISGTSGVDRVNIDTPFEDVADLKMAVPFVEADGELIYPNEDGTITISSSVKKLTIYSFVYNYSLLNPQVSYYLEGFDNTPTTVLRNELIPINYTNLKGGDYRFVMNLADALGRGSKEMSVLIRKERAIHEQLWFQLLMIIAGMFAVGFIAMLVIRRKTRIYEAKAEEDKTYIREMTEAFAKIIDMKDRYTNGHSMRVAEYTRKLTEELGYDKETVEKYYNIALLHDIGKIGVPPEVLNKPGKLTDEEFNIIKSHSTLGYTALKDISIMPDLAIGAGFHHERPDGKGYPRGLKQDEIPRVAQIIAVADTFDAMYSDRPYRKRMNFDKVVSIIREVSGTQLTPDVVDAFLRLVEKGELRDPNDTGGGSLEDIDNIHKQFEANEAKKAEVLKNVKSNESA